MSTPHARGSTRFYRPFLSRGNVYPACAGIHPAYVSYRIGDVCLPRMRGDPPEPKRKRNETRGSTPHARGSTPLSIAISY